MYQQPCAYLHCVHAEGCDVMYQPPYLAELGLGEQLQHVHGIADPATHSFALPSRNEFAIKAKAP